MKRLLLVFLVAIPVQLLAQLTVVSTTPADNATNVPLTTTFTMTFSAALDTTALSNNFEQWAGTNIDSAASIIFGSDGKSFSATIYLKSNKPYFFGLFTVKGRDGSILASPYNMHFTTASSFPANSVSGTISSGITGVTQENSIVALTVNNFQNSANGNPQFGAWGSVNANGTFTIPYVPNGTYWPLAAKDADNDGNIDPTNGVDVVAFGDSIVVNNSSVTNVNLTFVKYTSLTCAQALPIADSLAKNLPSDRLLKTVTGYGVDTLGQSEEWDFTYVTNNSTQAYNIYASSFSSQIEQITDSWYLSGLISTHTLTNPELAASSATVIANAEAQGGKAFRTQPHPDSLTFQIQMQLGDLSTNNYWDLNPNPSLYYWGVDYNYGVQASQQWTTYSEKKFLCDFTTGTVLSVTAVNQNPAPVPSKFMLYQNFPNPFNPSTTIRFSLQTPGFASLKVYDVLGREVATLVAENLTAGEHRIQWNASGIAGGVYFYRLQAGKYNQTQKLLLLK